MDSITGLQEIIKASQEAWQYVMPAARALLNVLVLIFETLANLIREGLEKM